MEKIVAGVKKFQKEVYPAQQELFEQLASGQHPRALFVACSDSRVELNLLTQAGPGELFICRNAGNIVPPHVEKAGGVTASIEYAAAVLNVHHFIVMGHTDCGAMKGALEIDTLSHLSHVTAWLTHAQPAVEAVRARQPDLTGEALLDAVIEENVVRQLDHMRTHPCVADPLAAGEAFLHGWVYDIKRGAVKVFDPQTETFLPLEDRYTEGVLSLMKGAHAPAG